MEQSKKLLHLFVSFFFYPSAGFTINFNLFFFAPPRFGLIYLVVQRIFIYSRSFMFVVRDTDQSENLNVVSTSSIVPFLF